MKTKKEARILIAIQENVKKDFEKLTEEKGLSLSSHIRLLILKELKEKGEAKE